MATTIAASARSNPSLTHLARLGFAAKGIVYLMIGALALLAAFGNGGQTTDQRGAIRAIAEKPFGEFALAIIGIGLIGYALWRFASAVFDTEGEGSDTKGMGKRAAYFASGIIHSAIAIYTLKMVAGSPGGGGDGTQTWTARALAAPAGEWLIAALGLAIIVGGIQQFREGMHETFMEKLRTQQMNANERDWARKSGKWGYAARGVVFIITGGFLMYAAWTSNPAQARGLEGVLDAIAAKPYGQWLLAAMAAGLICYGVFCFVAARYRRVQM